MMSVNGLKTITELRGISCIPLEEYSNDVEKAAVPRDHLENA